MRRLVSDAAVVADAKAGTADLVAAVRKAGYSKTSGRRAEIREATAAAQQEIQKVQPQMAYLNILREVLPANAIVTDELSQVGFASWYGFPVYEPRTFITSGYQGTLGSGFPTALGAKVANPDRPVVAITGDGGFMFAVQELSTAVQFKIGVVTLVFNNNAYGNVRRDQRQHFDGRVVASDLVNPDFVKLAESFGVGAARVTSPDHFRPALEKALADGGPYVISRGGADGFGSLAVDVHSSGEAVEHPVIPGRCEAANPESRDSGFDASHRPGMTEERVRPASPALSAVPATPQSPTAPRRPLTSTPPAPNAAAAAYSGSFCKPPATAAIRAKVASASAENTSPTTLPSAPVSPIASAAETAAISMQPQAAPATNWATISMLRLPAYSAPRTASAPNRPAAPITINPPRCLTMTLAGNIAMLKPIQNTGISHCNSSGFAKRR